MKIVSAYSRMLPNLSALNPRTQCAPCGMTFEEFEDALGSVPPSLNTRDDWSPDRWQGEDSPTCAICLEPLHRRARDDPEASKEVEALFEVEGCGHAFHRECLEGHITGYAGGSDRALRCPTCSRPIAQSVLDTFFDESAGVREVGSDDGFNARVAEQQQQQQQAAEEYVFSDDEYFAEDELQQPDHYPQSVLEQFNRFDAEPNPASLNDAWGLYKLRLRKLIWWVRKHWTGGGRFVDPRISPAVQLVWNAMVDNLLADTNYIALEFWSPRYDIRSYLGMDYENSPFSYSQDWRPHPSQRMSPLAFKMRALIEIHFVVWDRIHKNQDRLQALAGESSDGSVSDYESEFD